KSFFRAAFPSFSYFLSLLNVFLTRFHRTFQCFRNSVVQFSKTDFRRRPPVPLRACDFFIIPLLFPFVNTFLKVFQTFFAVVPNKPPLICLDFYYTTFFSNVKPVLTKK
ncbi:MAG: hypothetical protein IJY20_02160, partial [Clostridia bacterium]|nr:hypothetical protein [Clostridia bacterium]